MVLREFLNNQVTEIYNPNKTAYSPVIHESGKGTTFFLVAGGCFGKLVIRNQALRDRKRYKINEKLWFSGADWEERVLNSKLSSSIDVVIFFPRTIVDKETLKYSITVLHQRKVSVCLVSHVTWWLPVQTVSGRLPKFTFWLLLSSFGTWMSYLPQLSHLQNEDKNIVT